MDKNTNNNRLTERRGYRSEQQDYASYVIEHWNFLQRRQCKSTKKVGLEPLPFGNMGVAASDFALLGQSDHAERAGKVGLELPEDFLAFTQQYQEYYVVGSNVLHIFPAEFGEDITESLRWGEGLGEEAAQRIYRFAYTPNYGSYYYFRWKESGEFWDVGFHHIEDAAESVIFGEDAEVYHTDNTFTDWLKRMVETDCDPLWSPKWGNETPLMPQDVLRIPVPSDLLR